MSRYHHTYRRYFIISGRFLYKFSSKEGHVPKGTPIPLESAEFYLLNGQEEQLPHCFIISTLTKEIVVAAESEEESAEWVKQLR